MKKRILSVTLVLSLCLALPPPAVFAEEPEGTLDTETIAAEQPGEGARGVEVPEVPETPEADTGDFTVTGNGFDYSSGVLTINSGAEVTISMAAGKTQTSDRISVEVGGTITNITLAGVNIDVRDVSGGAAAFLITDVNAGAVTVTLAAGTENTLISGPGCAGLQMNGVGGTLTIEGPGALYACGGHGGAGIGGGQVDSGTVTINGGTVTAIGGDSAAGIGNGSNGSGSSFFTGKDGNAFIAAKSGGGAAAISDTSGENSDWSGVIFQNTEGKIYGASVTLSQNTTIPQNATLTVENRQVLTVGAGKTLTIPTGAALAVAVGGTVNDGPGTITGGGTCTTENLTEHDIDVSSLPTYTGEDQSTGISPKLRAKTICEQAFTITGWSGPKVTTSDNLKYTVTYKHTSGAEVTRDVMLARSGAMVTAELKGGQTSFSHADTITITGTVTPTGEAPLTNALPRAGAEPAAGQVSVYKKDGTTPLAVTSPNADGTYMLAFPAKNLGEGSHALIVKYSASGGMAEAHAGPITVHRSGKSVPAGTPAAGSISYGQAVGGAALTGMMTCNGTPVDGTFAWDAPNVIPDAGSYTAPWTFTPADTDLYEVVRGSLAITVNPASIAGAAVTLTPAVVPENGAAQRPEIHVDLGGVTLTEGTGYTVSMPSAAKPGTYTVTVTGRGNYTGKAAAVFTVHEVRITELRQTDKDRNPLRVLVELGLSTVPEALRSDRNLDTPEEIERALRSAAATSGGKEQTAVYYVTLQYQDRRGVWRDADPEDYPRDGVTAILPYPGRATSSDYLFAVRYMVSDGRDAGRIREPDYELTRKGLECAFFRPTPVAVGYQKASQSGGGSSSDAWSYAVTVERASHGKVTSNRTSAAKGNTVTLTVTPNSGYLLDTLTVTDSRGYEIKLTAKSGRQYTFSMPGRAVTVKAAFAPVLDSGPAPCNGGAGCPSRGFTDLGGAGAWYHEAVDFVVRCGLMNGYDGGVFKPDRVLSRAQLTQILYNMEGRPAVNGRCPFSDVADSAWCAGAVTWANQNGVVSGYGGGTFGPDDPVTREQLAVMLWRYARARGRDVSVGENTNILSFPDFYQIGEYAIPALQWAAGSGVVNGYANRRLEPKGLATRAQVAAMLTRYLDG